jgi:DNA helicase HerA-like ATPase
MSKYSVPKVATVAINVKGADLLYLDHIDSSELEERDYKMWKAAGVSVDKPPFGRVLVYVPLQEDGFNRNSLRANPAADIPGYSETREFTLGIQDLWPYLDLFFDKRSTGMMSLLAEIAEYFRETQDEDGFTLADVLHLFKTKIKLSKSDREEPWKEYNASTIQAVAQRFSSLPATLSGLIDVTGRGYGLDRLADLQPYDMVVVDIERIMANPRDPEVAESAIKIITAFVLKQLTEAMTQGKCGVEHIIVFADELNRLAPRDGNGGIGEYLSQLARTTRDRGIVLFGAGQFRSGINEDILKAASVHYSMQTPEQELSDRMYTPLSQEFKARLTQLKPGETLLQYPSLRTAVFAHFPRPFVVSGATKWREKFPPLLNRPLAECVAERLRRLDLQSPLQDDEVKQLLDGLLQLADVRNKKAVERGVIELLRGIEIEHAGTQASVSISPWQQFSQLALEKFGKRGPAHMKGDYMPTPTNFREEKEEWI